MRNLRLFISEDPEMVWLLFKKQNQHSPHRESRLPCRFLPCQKHLVGFGMLLNSASAVPIRRPHDVQDALETPCPSAPGARGALPGGHCWERGCSEPHIVCGGTGDHWEACAGSLPLFPASLLGCKIVVLEGMAEWKAYAGMFCCTGDCLGPQILHGVWAADLIAPGLLPCS